MPKKAVMTMKMMKMKMKTMKMKKKKLTHMTNWEMNAPRLANVSNTFTTTKNVLKESPNLKKTQVMLNLLTKKTVLKNSSTCNIVLTTVLPQDCSTSWSKQANF